MGELISIPTTLIVSIPENEGLQEIIKVLEDRGFTIVNNHYGSSLHLTLILEEKD